MKSLRMSKTGTTRRKIMGAHYTPRPLADFLADRLACKARDSHQAPVRILDPACGDGVLLESLLTRLQDSGILHHCEVVGVDPDPLVLPGWERRLGRFGEVHRQLVRGDFLDIAATRRGEMELWQSRSGDPTLEHAFDIVIANPPYVRTQLIGAKKAQQLAVRYGLTGRIDLYHAFLVGATETMRAGGHMGIITSNRFLSTAGGSAIRGYLARNYEIEEVIDLGDTKLFDAAVLPAIFIGRRRQEAPMRRARTRAQFIKVYSHRDRGAKTRDDTRPTTGIMEMVKDGKPGLYRTSHGLFNLTSGELIIGRDPTKIWSLTSREETAWLRRVGDAASGLFEDVAVVRVGIKTTADDVFIRSDWNTLPPKIRPEPELLRDLLTHEDARRWTVPGTAHPSALVLYPHEVSGGRRRPVDLERYPRAKAYLESNRKRLQRREYVLNAGRRWYEIWVPQNPDAWAAPKIVFPDISPSPRFYLDLEGYVVNGDCYWITLRPGVPRNVIYLLLALANSSLMTRFHDLAFNNKLYSARRRYITQYVAKYPCSDPGSPHSQKLIALARQMVRETKRDDQSKDHPLHAELDVVVQRAFGLEPAEGVR